MKRTFPKLRSGDRQAHLTLADTLENARELAWFLIRFPMEMRDGDRARLERKSDQHKAFAEDVGRMVSGDYVAREFPLALPLRNYQRVGADLALHTKGLLIGDEVGLGKTAQAIAVLSDPSCRPALVVTLTHLPAQWKAELEKFLPGIRVHALTKGTPYRLDRRQRGLRGLDDAEDGGMPDVIISNYHKLDGWAEELATKIKAVVFDECQELRHNGSAKYGAAKRIAAAAIVRLGLSATPIFNYAGEIFNLCDILQPGALGDRTEFNTEWMADDKRVGDPRALGSFLREAGLMLRRTRSEVGRELPPLTVIPHEIQVDFSAIEKLAGGAAELARTILKQGGANFDRMKDSAELSWRLRQATGIAKGPFVADFVRLLVESGESVLLAGWHHEVYGLWRSLLADLHPAFFTGEESAAQKEAAKQAFVSGRTKVLIMSLRAGAGIDGLQKCCRTVVYGEPDWSPAVHEQFTGRVFRDGQPDPVTAYFLLADSGSDPVIADVLGLKRAQLDGIRDPTGELIEKSQVDPGRIRRLAEAYLAQRGEAPPESVAEAAAE